MERKNVIYAGPREIVYQPGNATRYEVCLAPLSEDRWFFLWVNKVGGGAGMVVREGSLLHYSYFMEKTGISNNADSAALLVLLKEEVGISIGLPPHFDEKGLYIVDRSVM